MPEKTKFKLSGSGRVKVSVDDKVVIANPGDVLEVNNTNESYHYFLNSRRWHSVSSEDIEKSKNQKRIDDFKADLKDDGKINHSNNPNKKSPGRKKKEDE